MPFVLSLDEGTTSARAALYDERGRTVAMESAPVDCRYPQAGWVEQDADEIWNAQLYAARLLLDHGGVAPAAAHAAPCPNRGPRGGGGRQDADEIWNALLYAPRLLLDRAGVPA